MEYRSFARLSRSSRCRAGETREWDVRLAARANFLERDRDRFGADRLLAETTPDLVDVITREQIDQRQEIWLTDMLASQQG